MSTVTSTDDVRHPPLSDLLDFVAGSSPESEAEALCEHLATCAECAETVLEARQFEPGRREPTVSQDQRLAALARFEASRSIASEPTAVDRSLDDLVVADRSAPVDIEGAGGPSVERQVRRSPARWLPIAASWFVTALAVVWVMITLGSLESARSDVARLESQLGAINGAPSQSPPGVAHQPSFEVATVNLLPVGFIRGTEATPEVTAPASAHLVITMHVAAAPDDGWHRLELIDPNGVLAWSGNGLQPALDGTFRVSVPGGFLSPGRHQLRLLASGEPLREVAVYELDVVSP